MTPTPRHTLVSCLLSLLVVPLTAPLRAQDRIERTTFYIDRAPSRIQVDAFLEEEAWQHAVSIPILYEISPGNNTPARVETTCKLTYDDTTLYFACEALDPNPDQIRAYLTDRDNLDGHDRIALVLDLFNDSRRGFDFVVNPFGVQKDSVFDPDRGVADDSWDAIWDSAGRLTEHGYVIEAAIPFKSLRFPDTSGLQTWGFYFWRNWSRSEQVWMWSAPWDRSNSCQLCQVNLLTGLEGITPSRNIEFTPTFTTLRTERRGAFPDGPLDGEPLHTDVGLNAHWGLTTDVALNATLNPDFSQVEADIAQLDVNNQFTLRFPERRLFFLEGADLFQTPLEAVFTRSIADPSFGTKLTGKRGTHAFGVLLARDDVTNLLFPENQTSTSTLLSEGATSMIGRYRRDVGVSGTVGMLYTGREGPQYHNRVGGLDGFFRLWPALSLRFQYLHTETRYPTTIAKERAQPGQAFGGDALDLGLEYETRNWQSELYYTQFSPGFRADAGFISRVDARTLILTANRSLWGQPDGWFTRFLFGAEYTPTWDFQGHLTELQRLIWIRYTGPLQTFFQLSPQWHKQTFHGQDFTFGRYYIGLGLQPSGTVVFRSDAELGGAVDFTNVRQAQQRKIASSVRFRLGRRFDVDLRHELQRLSAKGTHTFTANLLETRTVYNFSRRAFIRAILQFRHVNRNPDSYLMPVDRRSQSLFSQVLFSYTLNPQSVVFLGYSDNRLGLIDADQRRIDLTQTNRTLFLKIGYAWRP